LGSHYHSTSPQSYLNNPSISQNPLEIIEPSATHWFETDHGGIESELAKDAEWIEALTELPIELGGGYLPEEEPVMSETFGKSGCSIPRDDTQGPPPGSRVYTNWTRNSNLTEKIARREPMTRSDYDRIQSFARSAQYQEDAPFLLPLEWRQSLYQDLFFSMVFTNINGIIQNPFVQAVIESKALMIRAIENFILRVWVELGVDPFPSLEYFVDDFKHLSQALTERVKLTKLRERIIFDQVLTWSRYDEKFAGRWRKRWENLGSTGEMIAANGTIKRDYVCGVFDVLFGIWQMPGRCWFHDGWLRLPTKPDHAGF